MCEKMERDETIVKSLAINEEFERNKKVSPVVHSCETLGEQLNYSEITKLKMMVNCLVQSNVNLHRELLKELECKPPPMVVLSEDY